MIRFVCGCTSKMEVPVPDFTNKGKAISTFDSVAFDAEGFLVCAIHRQRRLGWRSVPYTATTVPDGLPHDMTEFEWEHWVLYRIEPRRPERDFNEIRKNGSDSVVDCRDSRDPGYLGVQIIKFIEKRKHEHTDDIHHPQATEAARHCAI